MKWQWLAVVLVLYVAVVALSGCATTNTGKVEKLSGKVEQLEQEKVELEKKTDALEEAKMILEERLAKQLKERKVLLELGDRGLVITMTNDILFNSGMADLKKGSHDVLNKVAAVIQEKLPDRNIGVEGHTDNVPIKRSSWKSNWELSTARATNVLHYLIDTCGMSPERLVAIGYGEHRPIADNATAEGRAENRRVEIVILPKELSKASYEKTQQKASEEAKVNEETKVSNEAPAQAESQNIK